jgi:hypothetical protein
LASPGSRFQFPGLIARPSGYDNFPGLNGAPSTKELPIRSPIIVKYDTGHTLEQLAPLGDFWVSKLPAIRDRDGRELPVQDMRQLDPESSEKCRALVENFGSTYRATGAMVLRNGDQIHLAVRVEAQHWTVGALMTTFSSGNGSTWTTVTMMYETGNSPWIWDYTNVLLGPDVEFEPTAVLASDISMDDAIDESEADDDVTMASDSGDDNNGGGDDGHDDFFDDDNGGTGGGAVQATAQSTQSDQEMKDVDTYGSGRGHGNYAAGSGSSKQSGHGGASVAAAAAAGTTNQASNIPSGFDAAASTPTTTTTTRREIKQAPAAPAPALQDSTTTTLPTPVSATPNDASIGQAPQFHAGPTSMAPNTVTVNTATVTTSNTTAAAAAIQSMSAKQTTLVERLKKSPTNDTEQTSSQSTGITESAGADNAEDTHEAVKGSDNTASGDTAVSTGDENVSDKGADEGANEGANEGADESERETDEDDNVKIITGN